MLKKNLWKAIKYLNKLVFYLGIYVYVNNYILENDPIYNATHVEI